MEIKPKLGEILVEKFGVNPEEIKRALELQKKIGGYLGQILVSEGVITEKQLLLALSEQLGIPIIDDKTLNAIEPFLFLENAEEVGVNFLLKNYWLPLGKEKDTKKIVFITLDPLNSLVRSFLSQRFKNGYKVYLCEEGLFSQLSRNFTKEQYSYQTLEVEDSVEKLKEIALEAPVIKYLNQLITRAVEVRATDIHIEPVGREFRVRFRVDGFLHTVETLEKSLYLAVVSRIKLLAGLDIAEKRLPQDGKVSLKIASTFLDIRVSTIPMIEGESVVLRLLYRERLTFDIETLGLERDHKELLLSLVKQPYGMILITGPTGSGKTTTIYSLLTFLNTGEKKIITVEDPVEYQLEGINQIQVKPEIGLNFAQALRAILRHDPDIIMIGEIRDKETAEIAVHSALTGHLVLTTLHTNDAPSALFRLVEMGLEDYLLNASIIGVVAQRIVRKVCPFCEIEIPVQDLLNRYKSYGLNKILEKFKTLLSETELKPKKGRGCEKCLNTGYLGRLAIFEIFYYEDKLKEVFIKYKSLETLRKILSEEYKFRTLREDGFVKVLKGFTTVEEVLRVS